MGETCALDVTIKAMDQAFQWTELAFKIKKFEGVTKREEIISEFARAYEAAFAAIYATATKQRAP